MLIGQHKRIWFLLFCFIIQTFISRAYHYTSISSSIMVHLFINKYFINYNTCRLQWLYNQDDRVGFGNALIHTSMLLERSRPCTLGVFSTRLESRCRLVSLLELRFIAFTSGMCSPITFTTVLITEFLFSGNISGFKPTKTKNMKTYFNIFASNNVP